MEQEEEKCHDRQNMAGICVFNINIPVECYLVIVCFTVGQALALVVTVSQERFLTLSTHKMLQTKPTAKHMWLAQLSVSK